jgi:hypothetical protein
VKWPKTHAAFHGNSQALGFLESGVHDGIGLLGESESEIDHSHSFSLLIASVELRISLHNWCSKLSGCDVASRFLKSKISCLVKILRFFSKLHTKTLHTSRHNQDLQHPLNLILQSWHPENYRRVCAISMNPLNFLRRQLPPHPCS